MLRPTTPEETALYQTWLAEAKSGLHQLMTGRKAVTLSYNGESVTYRQTDEASLRRYINELSAALGLISSARRAGVRA